LPNNETTERTRHNRNTDTAKNGPNEEVIKHG